MTIVTVWSWKPAYDADPDDWSRRGVAGISPGTEQHWLAEVERVGHAITTVGLGPWNHHVIGFGVGHDDAKFCESRGLQGSMAAYYENGDAWDGRRWWEDTDSTFSDGVKYYGCQDQSKYGRCGGRTRESEVLARMGGVAS